MTQTRSPREGAHSPRRGHRSRVGKLVIPIAAALAIVGVAALMYFVVLPGLFGPREGPASASGGSAGGGGGSSGGQGAVEHTSVIATADGDSVPVYRKPAADGQPWKRLSNPNRNDAERTFLVKDARSGGRWLKVLLPIRPNGTRGWVQASDVNLSKTTYRVHVYLSERRVVAKHGQDKTVVSGQIGIGEGNTPTPDGEYYITSLLKPPKKNGVYGAYAFGLSGFSRELDSFAGGPGRIGLHGTNKPELLGQRVSAGCIRMSNANIRTLAGKLPLGTPVYVHS